ncbi:MAG TPA: GDP-mannose 4,6-dehydratase [Rhizomicrobium sp.]|nr:GDP-mannose 4,6-dehydratase [Rhizomicrobium sp.]
MTSTALIFGVSGQTGSYLAHLLLGKGYRVVGTSRDAEINGFPNLLRLGIKDRVQLRSISLSDFRSVLATIQEISPDEIYNLAGQSSVALSFDRPAETFESIAMATLNILECLRFDKRRARLFNATSSDCFGTIESPANENTAFRPQSPYGMAKAAAFWSVVSYRHSYGIFSSNGILSNHESPLRPNRFVTRKIITAANRIAGGSGEKLVLGDLSVERDWGWAPDYAEAMWRIMHHDVAADFVVATGKVSSLQSFVDAAFRQFRLDWRDHVEVDTRLFRPSEIQRVQLDPSRIAATLGWRARIAMPDLVETLVAAERNGDLGPLPWQDGKIADQIPTASRT